MSLKNHINNNYDSDPTAFNDAVGGNNQEWNILNKLGQNYFKHSNPQLDGEVMGELEYVIKKLNRLNCPITLNSQDSTFLDVGVWSYFQKRLSISTIEKRLRYARFMENHPMSVDFSNPNYENFRRHMDYREEIEQASANALVHEWKTMRMFLEAFNILLWPYKPPIAPKNNKRILPFPDVVRQFFYYEYSGDPYERALYQYLFYHSFLIGWRAPSEICEMTVNDVIIDNKGRGSITITETKKRRSQRTILPEKFILSSRSHKSFKNWIDHWRPKVENQYSRDALYLQPSGKPFTVRHLGHKLSKNGKKIWPCFRPYDMRHWCAVSRMIHAWYIKDPDPLEYVENYLGHEEQSTTEGYSRPARDLHRIYNFDWFPSVLKFSKKTKEENTRKSKHDKITFVSNGTTGERIHGPAEI